MRKILDRLLVMLTLAFVLAFSLASFVWADNATATAVNSGSANLWSLLMANLDAIWDLLAGVVIVTSIFVAGTRTPDPNSWIGKIYKVIEWLSLNFGKAKDTGK